MTVRLKNKQVHDNMPNLASFTLLILLYDAHRKTNKKTKLVFVRSSGHGLRPYGNNHFIPTLVTRPNKCGRNHKGDTEVVFWVMTFYGVFIGVSPHNSRGLPKPVQAAKLASPPCQDLIREHNTACTPFKQGWAGGKTKLEQAMSLSQNGARSGC